MLVMFPSLYVQIALTITLILLGAQSTKKAIDITKKENEEAEKKKLDKVHLDPSDAAKGGDDKAQDELNTERGLIGTKDTG